MARMARTLADMSSESKPIFTSRMSGELLLDIVVRSTMLVHHKVTWTIHNLSDPDLKGCDFFAASLVPRTFADINFRALDQEGNELRNVKATFDQPYQKAIAVPFGRRILPNEDVKVVLEYDWEEPDREYIYNFAVPYDKFKFILSYPKELLVNAVIHKTGFTGTILEADVHLKQPFAITDDGKRLTLEWEKDNIIPPVGYSLRW